MTSHKEKFKELADMKWNVIFGDDSKVKIQSQGTILI